MEKFRHEMCDVFTAYTDLHEPVEEMEKFRHEMCDVFTAYTDVHVLSPQSPLYPGMINIDVQLLFAITTCCGGINAR